MLPGMLLLLLFCLSEVSLLGNEIKEEKSGEGEE